MITAKSTNRLLEQVLTSEYPGERNIWNGCRYPNTFNPIF